MFHFCLLPPIYLSSTVKSENSLHFTSHGHHHFSIYSHAPLLILTHSQINLLQWRQRPFPPQKSYTKSSSSSSTYHSFSSSHFSSNPIPYIIIIPHIPRQPSSIVPAASATSNSTAVPASTSSPIITPSAGMSKAIQIADRKVT